MSQEKKTEFMRMALEEAKAGAAEGEIPVGALIVKDGIVLARGHNMNRNTNNPVGHAEIKCIEEASRILGNERLLGCDLYATKEPCAMCAGAIVHARIKRVIIGTEDAKYGACGTVLSVCGNKNLNHIPGIEFGILRDEASALLKDFFKEKRKK